MKAWQKIISIAPAKAAAASAGGGRKAQCRPTGRAETFSTGSPTPWNGLRRRLRRSPIFLAAEAFVWHPEGRRLAPVARVNRVDMSLLKGIDRVRDLLVENTERFARGLPANNALLWGARGMGKSSLVKAAHAVGRRRASGGGTAAH